MGPDVQNGEILTTWKEIAAYLKSGVRTCLRWEAKSGLPVHRQEGAPKSRVYAYKHELDAWFKSKLSNGAITSVPEAGRPLRLGNPLIFIPLLLLVAGGVFLVLNGGKEPPANPVITGVPQSTGPFDSNPNDIIESEFAAAGIMRVWRERAEGTYFETWRIEPVRHTSLAVGNLDLEPGIEVVAPGHCRETYEEGGRTNSRIRFFLNAYKYAVKDWWKTTFYDQAQCIFERDNFEFTETAIGNVDDRPGNEIVLLTAHALSVFRYDPAAGEIKLVCTNNDFLEKGHPLFRSLQLADIDNEGRLEILATANEGEEGDVTENKGWLFIFGMKNDALEVRKAVPLSGTTSVHSLRAGDVVPGKAKEVVFPLYKKEKDLWYASFVGWNPATGFVFEKSLDELGSIRESLIFLDIGDLISTKAGDEIVVARHNPNELVTYSWGGTKLAAGPRFALDHRVRVSGVQIGGSEEDPQRQASVLLFGSAEVGDQSGRYYLERINFTNGFIPRWQRLGGDKGELPISCASYAFKFQQ